MKECDILGVKTHSDPSYIFQGLRPQPQDYAPDLVKHCGSEGVFVGLHNPAPPDSKMPGARTRGLKFIFSAKQYLLLACFVSFYFLGNTVHVPWTPACLRQNLADLASGRAIVPTCSFLSKI